jgi:hypothetical protein
LVNEARNETSASQIPYEVLSEDLERYLCANPWACVHFLDKKKGSICFQHIWSELAWAYRNVQLITERAKDFGEKESDEISFSVPRLDAAREYVAEQQEAALERFLKLVKDGAITRETDEHEVSRIFNPLQRVVSKESCVESSEPNKQRDRKKTEFCSSLVGERGKLASVLVAEELHALSIRLQQIEEQLSEEGLPEITRIDLENRREVFARSCHKLKVIGKVHAAIYSLRSTIPVDSELIAVLGQWLDVQEIIERDLRDAVEFKKRGNENWLVLENRVKERADLSGNFYLPSRIRFRRAYDYIEGRTDILENQKFRRPFTRRRALKAIELLSFIGATFELDEEREFLLLQAVRRLKKYHRKRSAWMNRQGVLRLYVDIKNLERIYDGLDKASFEEKAQDLLGVIAGLQWEFAKRFERLVRETPEEIELSHKSIERNLVNSTTAFKRQVLISFKDLLPEMEMEIPQAQCA